MTRKPAPRKTAKRPPDNPAQYKRFLDAAKKAEASDDPKALERAVKKISGKTSNQAS